MKVLKKKSIKTIKLSKKEFNKILKIALNRYKREKKIK